MLSLQGLTLSPQIFSQRIPFYMLTGVLDLYLLQFKYKNNDRIKQATVFLSVLQIYKDRQFNYTKVKSLFQSAKEDSSMG